MKIIAGVHADYRRRDDARRHARCASAPRATRSTPASAWCIRSSPIVPDLSVAENVFLGTQPVKAAASSTGGAWCARRASISPASASTSIRATRMGSLSDRPAAADRDRPRALFRRAHHHPRRADLGAVAAGGGAAVRGAAASCKERGRSIVFISHFLDDILRISDEVTIFRNGRKVVTEPGQRSIDKTRVIERMIGTGHDELERELYRRDRARHAGATRPSCWRRAASPWQQAPSATSRSRCAPARCSASTASWAAAV